MKIWEAPESERPGVAKDITVGELRALLDGVPDDELVMFASRFEHDTGEVFAFGMDVFALEQVELDVSEDTNGVWFWLS